MNSLQTFSEILQVYPVKKEKQLPEFAWIAGARLRDEVLARFDTEIFTMTDVELSNVIDIDQYILVVGSRFGTMNTIRPDGVVYNSYYLSTGMMFGIVAEKKNQFQFEVKALRNSDGIRIVSDPQQIKRGDKLIEAHNICLQMLKTYFQI